MLRSVVATLTLTLTLGASVTVAQPTPAPKNGDPVPAPADPAPGDPVGPTQFTPEDLAKAQKETDKPWRAGVSVAEQEVALTLFNEGGDLLENSLFPKAVEKYREALEHWKHPAIYYNLALALVNLDQPLEMYDALEQSMKFGPAALDGDEKFDRAKGYLLLVSKQIGNVEYTLDVQGASLVVDGKEVFTGPGTYKARVGAGEHTIVARAEGYTPVPLTVKILGGTTSAITIPMYTDADLTGKSQLMPTWVPFSVLGTGVVVAAVGAFMHNSAKTNFSDYDAAIARCATTDPSGGCSTLPSGVADMKSTAESRQNLAIAAYAVGGLAIAGGVVLVILNRPKTFRIDPTANSDLAITPVISPTQAGFSLGGSF